jgi:thiol-disulfide isomerase/thioredoxin
VGNGEWGTGNGATRNPQPKTKNSILGLASLHLHLFHPEAQFTIGLPFTFFFDRKVDNTPNYWLYCFATERSNRMKKIMLLSFMSVMSFALFAKTSTPQGFTDDFDAALEASKKSGKTVFAVFSGSDWCYWCKVLEENYLSKKEFVDEASKNFELVYIDYPRDKGLLSEKALKRNPELVKKYGIRGFPTVKFIDSNAAASVAPRPAKGLTPKAYAQELVKRLKSKP